MTRRVAGFFKVAGFVAGVALLAACSHDITPTPDYSTPESIPRPEMLTVQHSSRGAFLTWVAPDSDFAIVQGWHVYKQTPDSAVTRLTDVPLQVRTFEDREEPRVGVTRYWVTAMSRGNIESRPSGPGFFIFDEEPPSAPHTLTALPQPGHIVLQWRSGLEPDLAFYTLYKDGLEVITINDPAMPIYFDFQVVPGEVYEYYVTVTDFRGHVSAPSDTVEAGI